MVSVVSQNVSLRVARRLTLLFPVDITDQGAFIVELKHFELNSENVGNSTNFGFSCVQILENRFKVFVL